MYDLSRNMKKKYENFLSENRQFLEAKLSIYLKRRVFVMISLTKHSCPLAFNPFVPNVP